MTAPYPGASVPGCEIRRPPLTGGCGCGAVRFEIVRAAGRRRLLPLHALPAPHGGCLVAPDAHGAGLFRLTAGEDDVAMWRPGGGFDKAFCRRCGSALFSGDPDDTSIVSVRFAARSTTIRRSGRRTGRSSISRHRSSPIPDDGLARYGGARPERSVLAGTRWRAQLAGPVEGIEAPTIGFGENWSLTGSSGVNHLFGACEPARRRDRLRRRGLDQDGRAGGGDAASRRALRDPRGHAADHGVGRPARDRRRAAMFRFAPADEASLTADPVTAEMPGATPALLLPPWPRSPPCPSAISFSADWTARRTAPGRGPLPHGPSRPGRAWRRAPRAVNPIDWKVRSGAF